MATKKPKNETLGDWSKVFVFGGEPWKCQCAVESALSKSGASSIIRFTKHDSCADLLGSLTKMQWEATTDAVVLTNPTAEQLKVCYATVMPGPISAESLIIVTPGDTLDGRSAFASKAGKADRVWYFDFPEANNAYLVSQHLKDWEKDTDLKISQEAKKWIADNAPTKLAKVRTAKGKTETEVFNLLELENELDKIITIAEEGETIDLDTVKSVCYFEQTVDVWKFITAVQKNDMQFILSSLDNMNLSQTNQGGLWLLANQLGFLMTVRSMMDKGLKENEIITVLSNPKYMGKYLNQNWEQVEHKTNEINPWRVARAITSLASISTATLGAKYASTINAVKDLRGGMTSDTIIPYLTLALLGRLEYYTSLREREQVSVFLL